MSGDLVVDSVGCVRGRRVLLRDFSMRAAPGEMLAVTGPSGSGKSTLLMLLAGLEPPDRGCITLDGEPVRPGVGVAVVLQNYGLISMLTAAENVEIVLQARRLPAAEVRRRSAAALDQLGLAPHVGRLIDELSGGQQQRVAIARAFVTEPRLLLVDEPTAELDPETQTVVLAAIDDARRRGAIVVMATHDPTIAAQASRVVPVSADWPDQLQVG